ncbi:hypothetical protein ACJIZ3_022822 [Penstemon smallii]|uniref:Prephenate/arogenate dehydrogenase domain-containing protein n=1 Tax=Penstemon smallii TaxID=265156 RepID=A0ABD3TNN1_9LAMI
MISFSSVIQPTSTSQPPTTTTTFFLPHHHHHLSFSSTPDHHHHQHSHCRRRRRLQIQAIDATQPLDNESNLHNRSSQSSKLKIAIIGFGNFGQFLAKTFIRQGHTVYAHSRSNRLSIAQTLGAAYFSDPHDLCERHPDVILFCTSIISTESVLKSLPLQRLRRNTLFVDVLSSPAAILQVTQQPPSSRIFFHITAAPSSPLPAAASSSRSPVIFPPSPPHRLFFHITAATISVQIKGGPSSTATTVTGPCFVENHRQQP